MANFSIANSHWPRYNHDNANSSANFNETQIGVSNVATLTQRWFAPTAPGDFVETEPIIVEGLVYTYSDMAVLTAYQINDGSQVWQTQLTATGQPTTNSGSSPLVSGNLIYAATSNLDLFALNRLTGVIVWQTVIDPTNQATGQGEVQASITEVDGLIIVPVASGDESTITHFTIRPTINAFTALTGDRIWSVVIDSTNGFGIGAWSTPSFDRKRQLMFIGTNNANTPPAGPYSDALQARNYRDGSLVWNQQYTSNDVWSKAYPNGVGNSVYQIDRDVGASPNLFTICRGGKAIDVVGASSKAGAYRVFKRRTGKPVWTTILTPIPSVLGNPGAAVAQGTIFAGMNSDPGPSFTQQLTIALANTPTFEDIITFFRAVYLGTTGFIASLNPCDGSTKWTVRYPSSLLGSPVYANGVVYGAWFDGHLRAFDASTGELLSVITTPPVTLPPPFNEFVKFENLVVSTPVVDGNLVVAIGSELIPFAGGGIAVYSLPSAT
jgi:outer membrane protein assembly factor BamB